ncbi:MAG: LLM class flavin-dependent oxidoreductase [Alphaproteobacteria bacterium]|nr:LLM class flavin-dependent oxidoreductase [Alphaproteobacteria bacterium]
MLRFSNFIFPEATEPKDDGRVIHESLVEAKLCDELGMEVVWLAEHHFDGNCAYVDPVSFAFALAGATKQITIGFAVAQLSLHHPIRMAEQMAVLDHLTKGRLIVGLGRGTAYNVYDYQGYDIDHNEAQARYEEADKIMDLAWRSENGFDYAGQFWNLKVPRLRPRPFTRPAPYTLRAASSEEGMAVLARQGLPFMMNVQSNDTAAQRLRLYRQTMHGAGFNEAHVDRCVRESWIWKNIFVADTDEEARRIALPCFEKMLVHRRQLREKIYKDQGILIKQENMLGARANPEHALICGSPTTVAEKIAEIDKIGWGGLILQFRLGPMAAADTNHSIRLFMEKVAPQFATRGVPSVAAAQ